MWKMSLPPDVVVSICSVRLRKAIPSFLLKLCHQGNQFGKRAAEAVEAPDDERVAGTEVVERRGKLGALRF